MAMNRKYLEEELNPDLRRELQMPVNMPLLSPNQLPTGTSYRQASPSVQMPLLPPGLQNIVPPERAGLLSPIPGRPGTGIIALPDSSELMSNTPRAAANTGLTAGEAIAQDRNQGNLISGLLGDINWKGILDQLIQTFQRPEMLTPGVNALTSFGMAGAGLNPDQIAGAREQAKLDQANQQQALENEYRRTRDTRDAARLTLAEKRDARDRLKAPVITKAKIDAFTALATSDDAVQNIVEKLDGTALGRALGNSPGADSIETAIAMEAITIQNNNVRMSPLQAVQEAAKRIQGKSGGSAPAPAPEGTGDITAYLEANRKSKSKKVN